MHKRSLLVYGAVMLFAASLAGGAALAGSEEDGHTDHHPAHRGHGAGHHQAGHQGGHHGDTARHGKQGRGCQRGPSWHRTLSDEQRDEMARLRAEHIKAMAPLKGKLQSARAEIVGLATANQPDEQAIAKKIDELAELNKEMMQQKVDYISGKRAVLTKEQRAAFDMHVMRRSLHHEGMGYGRGGHGH